MQKSDATYVYWSPFSLEDSAVMQLLVHALADLKGRCKTYCSTNWELESK